MFNLLLESAGETAKSGGGMSLSSIIIFGVMIVAVIGLFVWQSISNKKKRKQAQETLNQLKVGDRVKTIGGICGFVVEINDAENTFVLETGVGDNKSTVKFDKGAIYQTAPAQGNANPEPTAEVKTEEKPAEAKPAKAKKAPAKKATEKKAEEEQK